MDTIQSGATDHYFFNLLYMLIKLYLITLPVFFAIDMLWL